ncbi:GNAT family N-acetyltransferase [Haloglomus litoreum]|uniref:GNAT family N-acetyltransferase n=1 Tax=Haloglomus litoreum TaxID=3034026 RepID=UPI0023E8A97D|nr:GNAT family N-acetyltransferase [Haloglomus sp. DT116]
MPVSTHGQDTSGYEVRPFDLEAGDRAGFLDLYGEVFGGGSRAWFDWKYVSDPYTAHVPIVVATHRGTVVGAKAAMPFELSAGGAGEPLPALQPCDTMVHPDHRRQGLYSRMTELMVERYADRETALLFNFPNSATLAGSLKHGWKTVRRVPTHYRIQRAGAFLDAGRGLGRLADAAASVTLRARDAFASAPPDDVTVDSHGAPPVGVLASIAARAPPARLHAHRDERFYAWRLHNPTREYTTYVARRGGRPRAAAVVGTDPEEPTRAAEVVELSPLTVADRETGVLRGLLRAVVRDHADADVVAISGLGLPGGLLRELGFLSDLFPPLSAVSDPSTLVAYPLTDHPALGAVHDRDGWALRGLEQDTR